MEIIIDLTIDKKEENKKRKIQQRQDDKINYDYFHLRRQRQREFVFQQSIRTFKFFREMEELVSYDKKMTRRRRKEEVLEIVKDKIRATKFNLLIILCSKRYSNLNIFMVILSFI
jgi:NCAIR mutase (PurE)-related protein